MKEIQPHPEIERSFHELREEFRAQHQADLRGQFVGQHPVGWNMIGDPEVARDKFTTEEWAKEMFKRMDSPISQTFGLSNVPLNMRTKLDEQASAASKHEMVTWADAVEGVSDHDAPPLPLDATDDQICQYVEDVIERSKKDE